MLINKEIFSAYCGFNKVYEKGAYIFKEAGHPRHFLQVIEGIVKVVQYDEKGNEILLGLFNPGESFGEPPLLAYKPYPSHAIAFTNVVVGKISRDNFHMILDNYPDIMRKLLIVLSNRIISKSQTSKILSSSTAEEKIMRFFAHLKNERTTSSMIVPYTRQQIANITGLRVETVIRAIIKLSVENKLRIVNRKIQI